MIRKKDELKEPWMDEYWYEVSKEDPFGPCSWYVKVDHGWLTWGPAGGGWYTWTEKGAHEKALQMIEKLKKYEAKFDNRQKFVVK